MPQHSHASCNAIILYRKNCAVVCLLWNMQDINLFKNSPFLGSKFTLVALFALCSTINENKRGPAACSLQLHYLFFSFFHNTCFCLLFRLISTSSLLFPLQTFSLLFLVNWSLAQSLKITQKCRMYFTTMWLTKRVSSSIIIYNNRFWW